MVFNSKVSKVLSLFILVGLALCMFPVGASAQSASDDLPWEGAIEKLYKSFQGPVAYGFGILLVIAGSAAIMFGGDLQGWSRWICFACIVLGVMAGAPKLLSVLGFSATLIS